MKWTAGACCTCPPTPSPCSGAVGAAAHGQHLHHYSASVSPFRAQAVEYKWLAVGGYPVLQVNTLAGLPCSPFRYDMENIPTSLPEAAVGELDPFPNPAGHRALRMPEGVSGDRSSPMPLAGKYGESFTSAPRQWWRWTSGCPVGTTCASTATVARWNAGWWWNRGLPDHSQLPVMRVCNCPIDGVDCRSQPNYRVPVTGLRPSPATGAFRRS